MSEPKYEILVLDDEEIVGKRLRTALEKSGYAVEVFQVSREAVARIAEKDFDIVVTDIRMESRSHVRHSPGGRSTSSPNPSNLTICAR